PRLPRLVIPAKWGGPAGRGGPRGAEMNASTASTAVLAGVLMAGFGTMARGAGDSSGESRARIETMERQAQDFAGAARKMKGAHQQELLRKRARLESLIERLQAGEHVDPDEVDAVLGK